MLARSHGAQVTPTPANESPSAGSATQRAAGRWASRLADLGRTVAGTDVPDGTAVCDLWQILTTALAQYLAFHSRRYGRIRNDDRLDIVSQKALEILRSIENGKWKPYERSDSEIRGYLASVARNGLLDQLRRDRRHEALENTDATIADLDTTGRTESTANAVGRREFVTAAVECVGKLAPRSRNAWMLRVFADMPSREIAVHPNIDCRPAHVDVILQRARAALRECLTAAGVDHRHLVPGTFAALWRNLYLESGRGHDVPA